MADPKDEKPGVTVYSDHQVIVPPNRLKKAVGYAAGDDRDPVAEAEKALEALAPEFGSWMNDECTLLHDARQRVHMRGLTDEARQLLFRAAHDIKGHGATFGFPMAAEAADTLCIVLENSAEPAKIPLVFIDQCVDSVRAIIREQGDAKAEAVAAALTKELRARAKDILKLDETGKPAGASPPLAPA